MYLHILSTIKPQILPISQGESWGDVEMFYIVQFLSFLINIGTWGLISAGCQFFYLVAFY